jgi:hypothetical protein
VPGTIEDAWLIHAAHQMRHTHGKFLLAGGCALHIGRSMSG